VQNNYTASSLQKAGSQMSFYGNGLAHIWLVNAQPHCLSTIFRIRIARIVIVLSLSKDLTKSGQRMKWAFLAGECERLERG